jgi:hypothetical protein
VWSLTPAAERLLAQLDATVVGPSDGDLQQLVAGGVVDVAEADLGRAATSDSFFRTTVTGDVPVFAKFVSLVANAERWRALTDSQRAALIDAASDVRDEAIADHLSVVAETDLFCAREGAVVVAGGAALAAFRAAVVPAVDELDQETLKAIRKVAPTSPTDAVNACDGRRRSTPPASTPNDAAFPDGIYRLEWDADFAASWNATHDGATAILINAADVADLPAVVTWTMSNGRYDFSIEFHDREPLVTGGGTYRVDGNQLSLVCLPDVCAGTNVLRWSVANDGTLTMTQVDGRLLDPYYAVPWIRVGDPPPSA